MKCPSCNPSGGSGDGWMFLEPWPREAPSPEPRGWDKYLTCGDQEQ